jgi:aminomethyltransferase
MSTQPERTVLHSVQAAAGGKYVDFHGWDMPVQFAGIVAEHHAVRTGCGVFDLGHMGRLAFHGTSALAFLERVVTRALGSMKPGQVRYGLVLAEDGTVEDDVLVSREGEQDWHVVVNASNREKLLALWLPQLAQLPGEVVCRDLTATQAMIAVQGPQAPALLAGLGLDGRGLKYYSFLDIAWKGTTVRLSRTGYTGEDGFECFVETTRVVELWQAVVAAGATLCGLGARDTLRLEAGMPLYGNELDRSVTPRDAGLDFALNPQGGFIGSAALSARQPSQRLVGLRCLEKRVPRTGYAVHHNGSVVGRITSGTLSPTLGQAIGMAYVDVALAAPGTALQVDIRGTLVTAEVVALPFYKRVK